MPYTSQYESNNYLYACPLDTRQNKWIVISSTAYCSDKLNSSLMAYMLLQ